MDATTVLNQRDLPYPRPDDVIYIGRPSILGNPFILGIDGTREEVIAKYRAWVVTQPQIMALIPSLRGKKLICFCKPKACHGDVLAEMANALEA